MEPPAPCRRAPQRGASPVAREPSLHRPLVEGVGATGHLAHSRAPHLLSEKAEQLVQVSPTVAGTGTDDAANHPAERAYDSSLTEAMLRRVFRS